MYMYCKCNVLLVGGVELKRAIGVGAMHSHLLLLLLSHRELPEIRKRMYEHHPLQFECMILHGILVQL